MKIDNASSLPERYYGLHFCEGAAHYPEHKATIFIGSQAAKSMDRTFSGKPIFVDHVDNYDVTDQNFQADGWVVRSFYNPPDGKHWCEFLAITDEAKQAVKNGFKLSNSYNITKAGAGGVWHDIPYDQEVIEGEGDHIALVRSPRYAESLILTPDEFKEYNDQKQQELFKIANSKGDSTMFFKKKIEKVDNSKELLEMMVTLPKSKVEKSVGQIMNEADELAVAKDSPKAAGPEDTIEVGGEKMKVSELIEKYQTLLEGIEETIEEVEETYEETSVEEDDSELADDIQNGGEAKDEKEKEKMKKPKNSKENFESLKKAHKIANSSKEEMVYESSSVMLARGKSRY